MPAMTMPPNTTPLVTLPQGSLEDTVNPDGSTTTVAVTTSAETD